VRGIKVADGDISCTAEGTNEVVDRIITLTRIDVHYTVRLPEGADREVVDRALASHVSKCPTARSLEGAVQFGWTADIIAEGA
jgi:uncharacterized OsmC-like protein